MQQLLLVLAHGAAGTVPAFGLCGCRLRIHGRRSAPVPRAVLQPHRRRPAPSWPAASRASEGDLDTAADDLLKAQAKDPTNPDLRQQAFMAALLAGRPDAVRLARMQPDNQAAQLLLGDLDARKRQLGRRRAALRERCPSRG